MVEKKQIKINLNTAIFLVIMIFILVAISLIIVFYNNRTTLKNDILKSTNSGNYKEVSVDGKIYYQRLNHNTWKGQYHQDNFRIGDKIANIMKVVLYTEYLNTINTINSVITNKIKPYYSNKDCNYIVLSSANGYSWCEMELIDCVEDNNKIIIYGDEDVNGVMANGSGYFITIPTNKPVGTKIEYRECNAYF